MISNKLGYSPSYDSSYNYDVNLINTKSVNDTLDASKIKLKRQIDDVIIEEPLITLLENNDYMMSQSYVYEDFKREWEYKPAYASIEYYGTPNYWYLILFINNLSSRRQFSQKTFTLNQVAFIDLTAINSLNSQSKVQINNNIIETPENILPLFPVLY